MVFPGLKRISNVAGTTAANHDEEPKMHWVSIYMSALILFMLGLQFSLYFSSLWPYLQLIDKSASQTFYGFTLAAYSFGQMIMSPVFGFWNTRIKLMRPVVTVGILLSIAGNLIYLFTEASPSNRKWIILCARLICGLGQGVGGTIRGYVATASTPKYRARAVAIGTTGMSLGMTAGPGMMVCLIFLTIVQACVTIIGYPGTVAGPLHINQYTAPAYISIIAGLILLFLLITVFTESTIGVDTKKETDPCHFVPKYDMLAAILCILCWFSLFFSVTNGETVQTPFTMAVYGWHVSEPPENFEFPRKMYMCFAFPHLCATANKIKQTPNVASKFFTC